MELAGDSERLAARLQDALHLVCVKSGASVHGFSKEFASALEAYPWTGRRRQMIAFWEEIISSHPTSHHLSLDCAPAWFVARASKIQQACDEWCKLL